MKTIRTWKILASILVFFLISNTPVFAMTKISAANAIERANKVIDSHAWNIFFISNTGVSRGSIQAQGVDSIVDGVMDKNGMAQQWIIEYFKDSPKPYAEDGKKGFAYPMQIVIVTADDVSIIESRIALAEKIKPLNPRYINAMDTARKLAIARLGQKFDAVSVRSDTKEDGSCGWVFRFYSRKDGGSLISIVAVTGDGSNVVGMR